MLQNTVYLEELAYSPDSCGLFDRLRPLPRALFLDSAHPHASAGRFDILAADPIASFPFTCSTESSCEDIQAYFSRLEEEHLKLFGTVSAPAEDIPFCGGIAGYLDYGLGRPLQRLHAEPGAGGQLNAYNWAVVQDHLLQRCTFAALPSLSHSRRHELLDLLRQPIADSSRLFQLQQPFVSNMDQPAYQQAFQRIQHYILAGDAYQVNLSRCFSASYTGDPWQAYQLLRPLAGASFSGFLENAPGRQVLCLSPERFLRLYGRHVETRPIKGTRPRHRDAGLDELAARELRQSTKDRAENLMIVDLLRNDIGRSCSAGSVHVDRLFELESFPTVHHLVSTISGELLPERSAYDLLRDCFPGGSITGAPKRRAMEIIEELEPHSRAAYCGSLLYISADGRMDSNIAIRTLQCEGDTIRCWGGGGIVADSEWEREYQETWDKVGGFLQALEATL
jgi:para-aminobenzoate synthetase component 1